MKYIRTKDGRVLKVFCESVSVFAEDDGCTYYGENTVDFGTSLFLLKDKIIKEADTIEELCDEYVIIDEDNEPNIKQGRDIDHCRRIWAINNCLIYGAIWTEWGLKYVAKMNDKGELELL